MATSSQIETPIRTSACISRTWAQRSSSAPRSWPSDPPRNQPMAVDPRRVSHPPPSVRTFLCFLCLPLACAMAPPGASQPANEPRADPLRRLAGQVDEDAGYRLLETVVEAPDAAVAPEYGNGRAARVQC